MRILALLTVACCLLLANCSSSTSDAPSVAKPADDSATTTDSKQHTILSVERNPALSKVNIEVRLLHKLDEAEL
jgi:outer membrane biogenesis lipoprotein LolB